MITMLLRVVLMPLLLATTCAAQSYTISAAAPRLLFNNATVGDDLRQQMADGQAPATRFRDMVLGEMASPGSRYEFKAYFAALMYQVTGSATYAQFAHDRAMAQLTAEEVRIRLGQRADIAGDSYLEVGPLLGDLMLTMDWCRSSFTAGERTRLIAYANQTLFNLWNPDLATWGGVAYPWSGWSIDNPANNYYYSFLTATMLAGVATFGDNPQAQDWIDQFRRKMDQLDGFFTTNLSGGGSQEGTGYGTAMMNLFRAYYYWKASTGEDLAGRNTHAHHAPYWFVHATTPDHGFLAPTGDHARDSTAALFDYHRSYLLTLLKLDPADPGARVGKTLMDLAGIGEMANSFMFWSDYLYHQPTVTGLPLDTLHTAFYDSFTGVFATRTDWTTSATYLYQVAGPFTESHAHRDQGSFVLWRGGWLFDDENIRSHSGIEQDELYHNLVRFIGPGGVVPQRVDGPETQVLAVADTPEFSFTSCDTTPVYDGAVEVVAAQRELLLIKPDCLIVFDRTAANAASVSRVFTLNMSTAPVIAGDKLTLTKGANSAECWRMAPTGVSWTTTAYGGTDFPDGGVRAEAAHASGTTSRFLHVIGLNGGVLAPAASNTATETGVRLTLSDGRTATVRFTNAAPGGTLDLRSVGGAVIVNAALPTTVTRPPLLSTPDVAAPVISAVSVGARIPTGGTIHWTTDEPATGQVDYGTTAAYGSTTPLVATLSTVHHLSLSGLTPGTTYHFRVISRDAATNQAVSTDQTFATPLTNTPPTVDSIQATPATVTTVATALTCAASDDGGEPELRYTWSASPATVVFSRNGSYASKSSSAQFSAAGHHVLTVIASDAGSLTAAGSVSVAVLQTPTAVQVTPTTASVLVGQTTPLAAVVVDQFYDQIAAAPITWSVIAGSGSVSSTGAFSAPADAGTTIIRASSGPLHGDATITSTAGSSEGGSSSPGGTSSGCGVGLAAIWLVSLGMLLCRSRQRAGGPKGRRDEVT